MTAPLVVHEIPVEVLGRRVGTHTLHRGSSALTSCPVRSWEIVAGIEGWTGLHPAGWPERDGVEPG